MEKSALACAIAGVLAFLPSSAWAAVTTPACQAATAQYKQVAQEIAKANANFKNVNITNSSGVVNEPRKKEITARLARLKAQLEKALAAKTAACGPSLSAYDGTYAGNFPGTQIAFTFTVANGVISGDLGGHIADTKTGNAGDVTSQFPDANCGTNTLHFDSQKGTATSRGEVTCHLAGSARTGVLAAQRR